MTSTNYFASLPDELHLKIFRYLQPYKCLHESIPLVCQRWYILAKDPYLWSYISLRHWRMPEKVALARVRNKPNLKVLILQNLWCMDRVFVDLLAACPALQCLQIRSRDLSSIKFSTGVSSLTCLRHLSLVGCPKIHDSDIETLCQHLPSLDSIFLQRCSRLTDKTVAHLAYNVQTIRAFGVARLDVSDESIQQILCRHHSTLEQMEFSDLTRLTDRAFVDLTRCQCLEQLIFNMPYLLITDTTLQSVGQLTKLRRFRMCNGNHFSEIGLQSLFSKSESSLVKVDLSFCHSNVNDQLLELIAQQCHFIEYLNLSACHQLTDTGLAVILRSFGKVKRLRLKFLSKITVQPLVQCAPRISSQLEWVDLYQCAQIEKDHLAQLTRLGVTVFDASLHNDAMLNKFCAHQ